MYILDGKTGYRPDHPPEKQVAQWINYVQDVIDGVIFCRVPTHHESLRLLESKLRRIERKLITRQWWPVDTLQHDIVKTEIQILREDRETVKADITYMKGLNDIVQTQDNFIQAKRNLSKLKRYAKKLFDIGLILHYHIDDETGQISGEWFDGHKTSEVRTFYTCTYVNKPDNVQYIYGHYIGKPTIFLDNAFDPFDDIMLTAGHPERGPGFEVVEGKGSDNGDYSVLWDHVQQRRVDADRYHAKQASLIKAYKEYNINRVIELGGATECPMRGDQPLDYVYINEG